MSDYKMRVRGAMKAPIHLDSQHEISLFSKVCNILDSCGSDHHKLRELERLKGKVSFDDAKAIQHMYESEKGRRHRVSMDKFLGGKA